MRAPAIRVGEVFGRLTVVCDTGQRTPKGEIRWRCRCECGAEKVVIGGNLRSGGTRSCGCTKTHGLSRHPLYDTWCAMIARCQNQNNKRYASYGGRGITVCERWLGPDGFPNFLADMGDRPEGLTLDRTDNDGNYEPSNCRWATYSQQRLNQRRELVNR